MSEDEKHELWAVLALHTKVQVDMMDGSVAKHRVGGMAGFLPAFATRARAQELADKFDPPAQVLGLRMAQPGGAP